MNEMNQTAVRRHVPAGDIAALPVLPFSDALREAELPRPDYDIGRWLFVPTVYTEYRYLLGTRGSRPLICIGINPSTARPDHLDPTLQSVERIAFRNGFDSFMMLNLSAQRATDPDDMADCCPPELRRSNVEAFAYALRLTPKPVVWCAWGTMIEKRPYIRELLGDFIRAGEPYTPEWVSFGKRSKAGHPHHPLYLRQDAEMEPFDVAGYCQSL